MTRAPGGRWSALRHGDLGLFLGGRFLWMAAVQMVNVAVGWLVYDVTGSAMALGLVGLAAFGPKVALVLFTGLVADRFDRRLVLWASLTVMGLAGLGLLHVALYVALHPPARIGAIYALFIVLGAAKSFAHPTGQALLPSLVPREALGSAIALSSSVAQLATIGGPAIGGLLYALGPAVVFAAATAAFFLSGLLYAGVRHRPPKRPAEPPSLAGILAGLRFVGARPVILGAISLDLFAVLLGGATAMLPIFARDILVIGPFGLGALRAMPALGALAMGSWLAWRPIQRRAGRRMFQAVLVFGAATILFGLSGHLFLSMACLLTLGAADMVSVVLRQSFVQGGTPDEMRGRVAAVNSLFVGASSELGEFESGVMATLLGLVPSVVLGGVGTIMVAGLWAWLFPALRRRDRPVE